ncbi:MAG: O-antigen ligase family protein [Bdellovibrio sp.]|nr:O-antigen ligase family protein [Bdellovibrio sp.]
MIFKSVKTFFRENSFLNFIVLAIVFFIPLAWSRYLNANYVSAKFFLFFLVTSLALLVSFKKFAVPVLPKWLWAIFGVLVALHFTSPLLTHNFYDYMYLFKFFGFCSLAYYFYGLKTGEIDQAFRKTTYVIFAVVSLILLFALLDFYKFRIDQMFIESGYLLGSFGNVNMMAEFLILATPLVFHWVKFKDRVPYVVKFVLFTLWIFFIMYCRSRSTWMGLGLWTVWVLVKSKQRKELLALPAALIFCLIALNTPTLTVVTSDVKNDSFRERVNLYKATFALVAENPLGVGISHFDNFVVPYQEDSAGKPGEYLHYDQPHSEFLRWAAQLGWLGLGLTAVMLGLMAWLLLLKKTASLTDANYKNRNFLFESLLVLFPQMLFQFPFHNPASLLYLSFLFAMFLSFYPTQKEILLNWKVRTPIFLIAMVGVMHAFSFVYSIFLESTQPESYESVALACDLYPTNQNACFLKTYHLVKDGKYPQARLEFQRSFDNFIYHRGLLRILPTYVKYTAGDVKSCEAVQVYRLLFPAQKFFEPEVIKSCAGTSSPIQIKNPKQFAMDYRYWLNRQLQ